MPSECGLYDDEDFSSSMLRLPKQDWRASINARWLQHAGRCEWYDDGLPDWVPCAS
jgi:hypothetical protein